MRTIKIDFLEDKYYRLPRKLILNPLFWDRSIESITIFLLIAIKCSAIRNKTSCYIGYRSISHYCKISKSSVCKRLNELLVHDLPLLEKIRDSNGSLPIYYQLNRDCIPNTRQEKYFPLIGQLITTGIWNKISDNAKVLYLIIGGVSFQFKNEAMRITYNSYRFAYIRDVEAALDLYEIIKIENNELDDFLNTEIIIKELLKFSLIYIEGDLIRIPLLNLEVSRTQLEDNKGFKKT